MPDAAPVHSPPKSLGWAMLPAIVVIGIILRLAAAWGDPWLDEIWSWNIARSGELFAPTDNNHFLNTLWLWLVRDVPSGIVWRLPSVICGGAAIVLTAVLLRRFGGVHAILGALLMAVSQPMVMYQSEARGYAGMLLCMLAAFELQLRLIESPTRSRRLGMLLVCVLGTMSHMGFAASYLFILAWAAAVQWKRGEGWRTFALTHGPIVMALATWWLIFARAIGIGGGPTNDPWAMLREAASATVALPFGVAIALLVIGAALRLAGRRFNGFVMMLAALAVVFPLLLIAGKGSLVFVRYFLPAMLALLLLLSIVLGQLWNASGRSPLARVAIAGAIGVVVVVNVLALQGVLVDDRDAGRMALNLIAHHVGERSVGSDNDFQLRTIVDFYTARAGGRLPVIVEPKSSNPQWLVRLRMDETASIHTPGAYYERVAAFPARSWSGIPWVIYRRTQIEGFPSQAAAR